MRWPKIMQFKWRSKADVAEQSRQLDEREREIERMQARLSRLTAEAALSRRPRR